MGVGSVKRRLTTVLAADVVGYSRLIAADDEDTVHRLRRYRDIIDTFIARHDGRLFSTAGDSVMAEFPSAVEAARCAVEIQEEIALRNAELDIDQAMRLRIGINVGEAIVEGDDLLGDGINVAARLQEIAEPGGVLLSSSAHDQVKGKFSADIEPLGQHNLKNIPEPVQVFRLRVVETTQAKTAAAAPVRRRRWRRVATAAGLAVLIAGGAFAIWESLVRPFLDLEAFKSAAAYPLPQEPSIVVLPFVNSSGDRQQSYFSEGLSEDIMANLTKVSGLFVIGRNSAFSYSGKAVKAKFVGRDLGVRYVMQGSVRRHDDRVRVSTFLVDAVTGRTMWSGRYDRRLGDIFAVQDEISQNVVKAVAVNFNQDELEKARSRYAQNFAAYDAFLKGRSQLSPPTTAGLLAARENFERAIKLDPAFAGGYAGISVTHSIAVRNGLSAFPPADIDEAEKYAKLALDKNDRYAMAQLAMASAQLMRRNQDLAVAHAMAAYRISRTDANVNAVLGFLLTFAGRAAEALEPIDRALELERGLAARTHFFKMFAAYTAGEFKKASDAYKNRKAIRSVQCRRNCLLYGAATMWQLAATATPPDKTKLQNDAVALIKQLKTQDPGYADRNWVWVSLHKNGKQGRAIDDVLRKLWDKAT